MLPKAVLFDMDGLLVDSEPYWLFSEAKIAASLGISWDETDQRYCLGGPLSKVGDYLAVRSGLAEQKAQELVIQIVDGVISQVNQRGVEILEGGIELLAILAAKRIPIGLVSASPRKLVDAVLNSTKLSFDTVISLDDCSPNKPFPDPYLLAANNLNVSIEDCLILEDSVTGVTGACKSGAQVIGIPRLVDLPSHPNLTIKKSLNEVCDLFLKL